ncbi:MAG: hypothetical protein SFT81_04570 [Candidatus Caenarcaniphilales bacterium]|nr:hypothetical protein [Candidatus Caenarcaniphilales bacterium]
MGSVIPVDFISRKPERQESGSHEDAHSKSNASSKQGFTQDFTFSNTTAQGTYGARIPNLRQSTEGSPGDSNDIPLQSKRVTQGARFLNTNPNLATVAEKNYTDSTDSSSSKPLGLSPEDYKQALKPYDTYGRNNFQIRQPA